MICEYDFARLCIDARRHLRLDDLHVLSAGSPVDTDGLLTALRFDKATCSQAYLSLVLGRVERAAKIRVCEDLLTLQGKRHGNLDCTFAYNGTDDALHFRMHSSLSDETTGKGLAVISKMFAQQAKEWRKHILGDESAGVSHGERANHASVRHTSTPVLA